MTAENIIPENPADEIPADVQPDLMAGDHPTDLPDGTGNCVEDQSQADAAEDRATSTKKPDFLPEKFWDAGKGEVRMEALANSYRELERRLSRMAPDRQAPASSEVRDRYEIRADHGLFAQDEAVDERLKAAGLNQAQAQAVYDIAAEILFPALTDLSDTVIDRLNEYRLVEKFGGEARWKSYRKVIDGWARANLPGEAYEALSSSYEGICALERMMTGTNPTEPSPMRSAEREGAIDEASLRKLMRDPRYWRDGDRKTVDRVSKGFSTLYG